MIPTTNEPNIDESKATPNPGMSPIADALADDIALSLHESWKLGLKHAAWMKPLRPDEYLYQFFEYVNDQWPHNVVLAAEDKNLTYAELDARSKQLAYVLRQYGITPKTRVGISLPRSLDAYITLLAILKAGSHFLELDPHISCERIRTMASTANIKAIITNAERGLRQNDVGVPLILIDGWRDAETKLSPEQLAQEEWNRFREICYIIYNSGTAERPKAVAVEPRKKSQKLRSLVSQQNGLGFQALTISGRKIEGFLGLASQYA